MKKLIVGLMTAFLLATGLAAFAGSAPASAACPYSGCITTHTNVTKLPYTKFPNNRLYKATITADGNTTPRGSIRFTLYKGQKASGTIVKAATKNAPVGQFNTGTRPKGTYTLKACYVKAANSMWSNSCTTRTFTFNHTL